MRARQKSPAGTEDDIGHRDGKHGKSDEEASLNKDAGTNNEDDKGKEDGKSSNNGQINKNASKQDEDDKDKDNEDSEDGTSGKDNQGSKDDEDKENNGEDLTTRLKCVYSVRVVKARHQPKSSIAWVEFYMEKSWNNEDWDCLIQKGLDLEEGAVNVTDHSKGLTKIG
jgi:hypothetical protein